MAKLVCQAGPDAGHEYPVTKTRTVFGRRSGCEVQIMDSMASREHFEVRKDGQLYTLIDLESRNGTKVNGRKVTDRQLDFNDRIRVGEVEWMFIKEEGDVELKDLLTSKYELVEKVGEGGMGVVYKAIQRSMDRTVALKVLAPKYSARPKFVQRFIDEARAAGRLNHPNIIQVHDVDTENGIHYFSMEFIDGGTCADLIAANGPLPPDQALEITRLTAKALQYAHDNRLIHRDVKPDNIIISSGNVIKLADLGISKSFDEAEHEERPKRVAGTPQYMAPEAIRGQKIDHRVDIYSLGATLYHLLAGKVPFNGTSASEIFRAHVSADLPVITDIAPDVPEQLDDLIVKMMEKNADDRPASMTELISAIESVQNTCGYGSELPNTGDTLMLRRFANSSTNGSGTAGTATNGSGGSATGSQLSHDGDSQSNAMAPLMKWATIAVVLVIGGVLAMNLINTLSQAPAEQDAASNTTSNPPATTPTATQVQNAAPQPPAEPSIDTEELARQEQAAKAAAAALQTQQYATLRRLRERLANAPDESVLAEVDLELVAIENSPAQANIAERAASVRELLDQRVGERLAEAETERLNNLREEVTQLRMEHNYEAAMQRLNGFQARSNGDADRIIASLKSNLQLDRDSFISSLTVRIDRAINRDDDQSLRRIRDEDLPRSMIASDLADRIDAALRNIEQAKLSVHREHIEEMKDALGEWDLESYAKLFDEYGQDLSSGPESQAFLQLDNLANSMKSLLSEMQVIVGEQGRWARYHGRLGGAQNADITDIQDTALVIRTASGGNAKITLRSLTSETILEIIELILGEDGKQAYAPVIDALNEL